jgi:hypothetical protein
METERIALSPGERGRLRMLHAVGSLFPVGVVGFAFWRELQIGALNPRDSENAS